MNMIDVANFLSQQYKPWEPFKYWMSLHRLRLPLGLKYQNTLYYYGWENPSKPRELSWRLNIAYWWKCFLCYKFAKKMLIILQIWTSMNLFLFILQPSKLRASFIIHAFSKRSVGNGSPFTQLYSGLNKINKTYLPTLSTKTIFFFYERKKISFKKPSVQHYWHFKEFIANIWDPGGTTKFILLWEWQGEN